MVMIALSLTVYTGTAIVMALLGWHVGHREQGILKQGGAELPFASWEILLSIAVYVLVSAFRWNTSWDYNMYHNFYVSMQSLGEYSRENFELGFDLISQAMARSGLHFAFYFGFWALIHIALLYYALRHRKILLPWIALCVFLGPYYVQWMNTIRQSVVECLFVLMVELIIRRKFWLYLLLSLVAVSLHRMSVLLIPLYFIPLIPVKRPRAWMAFAFLAVCVVLGEFPQWIKWLFDALGRFASLVGYGHYYRLFSSNNFEYVFREWIGPARLCPFITCLFIIWYYPAVRGMFAGDKYLPALYRFSILHIAYINLVANTTLYIRRPGDLLRATFLIMVCYTFQYLWRERKWLPLAVMLVLNMYYIFYEMYKAAVGSSSIIVPEVYHTFLL